jgi:hypothetical protein
MIVMQLQSARHARRDGSEAAMKALPHWLLRLEAIGWLADRLRVNAARP